MGSYTLFFPYPFSSLPCSLPLRFSWPIEAEWRKGHWLLSEWNFPVLGPSKSTKSKHKQTNKKLRGRQSRERGKLGKGEGEKGPFWRGKRGRKELLGLTERCANPRLRPESLHGSPDVALGMTMHIKWPQLWMERPIRDAGACASHRGGSLKEPLFSAGHRERWNFSSHGWPESHFMAPRVLASPPQTWTKEDCRCVDWAPPLLSTTWKAFFSVVFVSPCH